MVGQGKQDAQQCQIGAFVDRRKDGRSSVARYGRLTSYWNGIDKALSPGTPWQSHLEGLESAAAFDHLVVLFLA